MPSERRHDDYTVGWICALYKEKTAAIAMLDSRHGGLSQGKSDTNIYTLGDIGRLNIVIACLPSGRCGTNDAANVATNMTRTFESLRWLLLVGIGGGVPLHGIDLRLGDLVVGNRVIQYDHGKAMQGGIVKPMGVAVCPHPELAKAASSLRADHGIVGSTIPSILRGMLENGGEMKTYSYPGSSKDRLFCPNYNHQNTTPDCADCDAAMEVNRGPRSSNNPKIHYRTIASGNLVINDSIKRDELSQQLGASCFEMEAAGLIGHFPCLVIRGICDYADSHKGDQWQNYAAAAAAAYAKELLLYMSKTRTEAASTPPPARINDPRERKRYAYVDGQKFAMGQECIGDLDPHSPVDVMKSFGLDSTECGRRKYGKDHGIEGSPLTTAWGLNMLNHVLRCYGRLNNMEHEGC